MARLLTKVTLPSMASENPCSVFNVFLSGLNKRPTDCFEVGIRDFIDHVEPVDAMWPLQNMKEFEREKRLVQAWCAEQLLHYLSDPSAREAVSNQITALRDDSLSDENRELYRAAVSSITLTTAVERSVARLSYKDDLVKVSESAAWVSKRGGCGSASFERQKDFLLSLSV